jgi:sporulation protein YlmC with PRC-barrel domain
MDLIRDCLDKQLIDRHGRKMGKVDGIVMELEKGRRPRIVYLEVGAVTQAQRLHPKLGKWAQRLVRKMRGALGSDSCRIPWAKVVVSGIDVTVGADAEETGVLRCEMWLREHIIGRIPGA